MFVYIVKSTKKNNVSYNFDNSCQQHSSLSAHIPARRLVSSQLALRFDYEVPSLYVLSVPGKIVVIWRIGVPRPSNPTLLSKFSIGSFHCQTSQRRRFLFNYTIIFAAIMTKLRKMAKLNVRDGFPARPQRAQDVYLMWPVIEMAAQCEIQ